MFNIWVFLLGVVLLWIVGCLLGVVVGVYCEYTLDTACRDSLKLKIDEIYNRINEIDSEQDLINYIKVVEYPLVPHVDRKLLDRLNGYMRWFGLEIEAVCSVEFANSIKNYIDIEDKNFARDKEYLLSVVKRASKTISEKREWKSHLKTALTFSRQA